MLQIAFVPWFKELQVVRFVGHVRAASLQSGTLLSAQLQPCLLWHSSVAVELEGSDTEDQTILATTARCGADPTVDLRVVLRFVVSCNYGLHALEKTIYAICESLYALRLTLLHVSPGVLFWRMLEQLCP